MKIIKYALIAGLGIYMLPAPPHDASFMDAYGKRDKTVSSIEMISAVSSAFGDVSGFCSRQEAVCSTAGQIFSHLEIRARYGIKRLYEWADKSDTSSPADVNQLQLRPLADALITGSTPVNTTVPTPKPSIGTLRIEDLIPEWRGPKRKSSG